MESLGIQVADIGLPGAGPHVASHTMRLAREITEQRMRIHPYCAARTVIADIRPIVEISQRVGYPIEVAAFIGTSPIRQYAEDWDLDAILRHGEEAALLLQVDLEQARDVQTRELERISGMTAQEARAELLGRSEELVRHEMARMVRQIEEEAQADAKQRARDLVADALQRVAASHAAETTVSLVQLPSDDMKGRIIGREGRNIRALENLTGVEFIIDDTPQAVVLSSFDGMRREIAKLTLAKLVEDGRIHPSRIEEMYYQSKAEIEEHVTPGRRAGRVRGELRQRCTRSS